MASSQPARGPGAGRAGPARDGGPKEGRSRVGSGVIHVTGFGKFCGVEHNPTQTLVLRLLAEQAAHPSPEQVEGESGSLRLEDGWALGSCTVLPVAGRGGLPQLLPLLAHRTLPPSESSREAVSQESPLGSVTKAAGGGGPSADVGRVGAAHTGADGTIQAVANGKGRWGLDAAQGPQLGGSGGVIRPTATPSLLANPVAEGPGSGGTGQRVVWLHLGVAEGLPGYHLEVRAVNEATFRCPDEMGWTPLYQPICEDDGPISFYRETDLPVDWLLSELKKQGFPVEQSTDAGRFVCNYVYYQSLRMCPRPVLATPADCHLNNSPHVSSRRLSGLGQPERAQVGEPEELAQVDGDLLRSAIFVHVPPFHRISEDDQMSFLLSLLRLLSCC